VLASLFVKIPSDGHCGPNKLGSNDYAPVLGYSHERIHLRGFQLFAVGARLPGG
jgi:hypothetical protein